MGQDFNHITNSDGVSRFGLGLETGLETHFLRVSVSKATGLGHKSIVRSSGSQPGRNFMISGVVFPLYN